MNMPEEPRRPELDPSEPGPFDPATADTDDLVRRAKEGDVDALNELFSRYHGTMVEMARRKLGPKLRLKEDPDDLAQTTFREATRDFARYEYRGEGSLLKWLVQILQNKIRDRAEFYSAGKRDTSLETTPSAEWQGEPGLPLDLVSPDLSVTRQVSRGENVQILRSALSELSAEHRQAITLVFFEGLSLRDAGARMGGRSEDAVRMLLRRAEARLREILRTTIGKAEGPLEGP
jgi:RNA polymerase sigma-70 factor (ECF subfamily)